MKRYRNQQANRGAGSCLQGGVPFLWLLDKPPAPGIKLPPRRLPQPADSRSKDLRRGGEARNTVRRNPPPLLSDTRRQQVQAEAEHPAGAGGLGLNRSRLIRAADRR